MFTGLIQDNGQLLRVDKRSDEATLSIASSLGPYTSGESIAINGACLSVTSFTDSSFEVFASSETLRITGLDKLSSGVTVNLERAMTLSDHVGGHLVTGHVDTRIKLVKKTTVTKAKVFEFALPPDDNLSYQIATKGSVSLDGVSLTVNAVTSDSFDVMVIPVTLEHTTLDQLQPGDMVNLETDLLAKYVTRRLEQPNQKTRSENSLSMDTLIKNGFVR